MTTVAKLNADLVANTSSFSAGLDAADRRLGRSAATWATLVKKSDAGFVALGGTVSKLTGVFGLLTSAVTGGLGAGMVLLAKSAVDAASAIDDTAQRLQISTTDLQKFQFAAKLAGLENEQLEGALTKLNAKLADGSLRYKNTSEALFSIAEAVKTARSDTERAAIVNDAFGAKMGAKLIPVLTAGAAGLEEMGIQAEKTGNVLSENTIKNAAAFGDQLDVLGASIKNNFQQGLLDAFVDKSSELKDLYSDPEFGRNIQNIGTVIGGVTAKAIEGAGTLSSYIIKLQDFYQKAGSFKFGLSQETFDMLKNGAPTIERSSLQPFRVGKEQFGPFQDKPQKITPYTSSAAIKKSDTAAQQAAKDAQQREKTTQQLLDGLRQENQLVTIQTSLYGQKESVIKRAQKEQEINNQLMQSGITLTQSQRQELSKSLDVYQKQTDLQAEQEQQAERLKEKEKNRQQAMDQLGTTIASSFEDAIVEGNKLSDVLDGLLKDIAKLLLRKNITEPLFSGLTASGGLFDTIGKSVFGGFKLPSFAVGTSNVPYDMTANIHKGEMIIPAREAAALRSGKGGGGGDVVVNVVNNAAAKVATSSSSGPAGTELTVMIDQAVADNISRPGSRTNQALSALSGRSLVRR